MDSGMRQLRRDIRVLAVVVALGALFDAAELARLIFWGLRRFLGM